MSRLMGRQVGRTLFVASATTGAVVLSAGLAFAFFSAHTSGSNTGSATVASMQSLTTVAATASTTSLLHPSSDSSGNAALVIRVTNPNASTSVRVSSIAGNGTVTGCTTPAVSVVTPTAGLPFTLSPGETRTVTLTNAVHMGVTSSSDCQNKTLTVPVLLNG